MFTHTRPCILCLCHHCSVAFFSLMPATCFTVLLFCFLAFRFIIVWHFYASTTSICTTLLSLQLDILFARSTKITSTTFRIYCICNFIAVCMCVIVRKILQKKVAVIIVEEEYVSSSVTHCCLLQQSAQPLHCSLTRVFSALFNAFFCHSKLITASANTHCIEVLQEIYHFRFFFLQKQEIYGVEKKSAYEICVEKLCRDIWFKFIATCGSHTYIYTYI